MDNTVISLTPLRQDVNLKTKPPLHDSLTRMATLSGVHSQAPVQTKRKYASSETHDPIPKKQRVVAPVPQPSNLDAFHPFLAKLKPKYEVKHMSVMPSTKEATHITKALDHLSRFSVWDQSVLPGVVLLTAKSVASGKLITIAEIVRRRIGECEQKWYQYNVLNEAESGPQLQLQHQQQQQPTMIERSVVEDTFMAIDGGEGSKADDDDDDYFETSVVAAPTIHEQAVNPVVVKYKQLMAVFISRVPLDELKPLRNIGFQTNEDYIAHLRKKKMGLVG